MPFPWFNIGKKAAEKSDAGEYIAETVQTISDNRTQRKTGNDAEATERHKHDMLSDSWLSKNIRPGILAISYVLFFILAFLDGRAFEIKPVYTDLLRLIFSYALPFYYGGRFIEKIAVAYSRGFKRDIKNRDK